jgi:hypothetical protein
MFLAQVVRDGFVVFAAREGRNHEFRILISGAPMWGGLTSSGLQIAPERLSVACDNIWTLLNRCDRILANTRNRRAETKFVDRAPSREPGTNPGFGLIPEQATPDQATKEASIL